MNVEIYVLHLVAQAISHPPRTYRMLLVDAHAFRTIRLAILMLTIYRGKVIQLRDRISPNRLSAFPPIRRTPLAVLILYPHCAGATYHM